ncbi:MAG: glycosyltransferase family 1 protein [Patescibacteria group bacterium]|jgi:glycosyltransferase involved in cell wall biosynthesis
MKIAIDARALTNERLTGVGHYTLELITNLADESPEDDFFVFVSGTEVSLRRVPQIRRRNIHLVDVRIPNRLLSLLLLLPFSPFTLESFLPKTPDVWIFPNHNVIKTNLPYLFTVHDVSFLIFPKFFSRKDRLARKLQKIDVLCTNAQGILAVSEATASDVHGYYKIPNEKIAVTHLGVDQTKFVPREQPSDKTFRATYDLNREYLLCAATLEPRKNIEGVIEAYDSFRSKGGVPLPLVIMGGNGFHHRRVLEAQERAMFGADIRFLGYVPEKHKPAVFRGASAFLFPSFYEGFGLPVLEAMASGVPVITSFTSSLAEITADSAILVDPLNVEDITQALLQLFHETDGEKLRTTLIKKGLEQAKMFTWKETARKTLETLESILFETVFDAKRDNGGKGVPIEEFIQTLEKTLAENK